MIGPGMTYEFGNKRACQSFTDNLLIRDVELNRFAVGELGNDCCFLGMSFL